MPINKADLARAGSDKTSLAAEIATRATDPRFYSALEVLPNPDTVLRRLGKTQDVFDALAGDPHVIGELRSIRAALLGFEWRLQAGGPRRADKQALELCERIMSARPAPGMQWSDVIWSMAQAVFRGHAVHEVVWERQGEALLPAKVIDRPQRRFAFDPDARLRLLTREQPLKGLELGAHKWLLTRHMASGDNPYGVAVYSACFWPYTFKHSGFKYFIKFSEKFGIPWVVGKVPQGTGKEERKRTAESLAAMVEDGVAVITNDGAVELLEAKSGGSQLAHERLINLCNREMSKALTSQTLATEIVGTGARAAAETHREREVSVNQSDRDIIEDTFNELFAWIAELNIPGAVPPRFEFFEEADARKDWAEVLDRARGYLDVPVSFAQERLQIPAPAEGEPVLPRRTAAPSPASAGEGRGEGGNFSHTCPHCGGHAFASPSPASAGEDRGEGAFPDQAALDAALDSLGHETLQAQAEALLAPILALAKSDPDQFMARLAAQYPDMDDTQLEETLARVIFVAETWGRLNGTAR